MIVVEEVTVFRYSAENDGEYAGMRRFDCPCEVRWGELARNPKHLRAVEVRARWV